jgi:U2 small nuclear ribonucleoprotein A'
MRLTVELIQNSLSYINPLTDRELDLRGAFQYHPSTWKGQILHPWKKELHSHRLYALSRIGHKIPAIENLGIAKVS